MTLAVGLGGTDEHIIHMQSDFCLKKKRKGGASERLHLGQQVRRLSCNAFENQRGLPVQVGVL